MARILWLTPAILFTALYCLLTSSYWQGVKGRMAGKARAQWEWEQGVPVLTTYGLGGGYGLDTDSGLPSWPIAGCVVDNWIVRYSEAHNREIQRLLHEYGLPDDELLRHVALIEDPQTWLDEHGIHQPSAKVVYGSGPVPTPDGTLVLALVDPDDNIPSRRLVFQFQGQRPKPPSVGRNVFAPLNSSEFAWYLEPKTEEAAIYWVPESKRLAVLAYVTGKGHRYQVLDLKTGGSLSSASAFH